MTWAFTLLTGGFLLLRSGWRGSTPIAELRGLSQPGPGGPLAALGSGLKESFVPSAASGTGGVEPGEFSVPTPLKGHKINFNGHPSNIKPGVKRLVEVIVAKFPGLTVTATTDGEHATGSYHYKGRAVDLAGSSAEMERAAKWIARTLTPALTEGIHNPTLSVKNHHHVSPSFWGAEVWSEHLNHIHVAV